MFKVLILQTMHGLSDERCEYLIKDRLSFMRFLGLGLGNTIWTFREALKKSKAIDALFQRFNEALRASGYLAMGGQSIDATLVAAPKQRNTNEAKKAIEAGRIPNGWKDKPAKLGQKDRDARRTAKFTKAKPKGVNGGVKPGHGGGAKLGQFGANVMLDVPRLARRRWPGFRSRGGRGVQEALMVLPVSGSADRSSRRRRAFDCFSR
jgi:IS5 family transposase